MNKIIVIAIVIGVVALGTWWLSSRTGEIPSSGTQQQQQAIDTTEAITNDLEALDLGDLDKAFEGIDADLNSL